MELNRETIDKICRHATEEYPYECCGIITGQDNSQTVHLCENIQNRLHKDDPERYSRDAGTAYTIDRSVFDRICADARENGEKVLAFYHSHIDCAAYFSETDVAAQTVFGEPEFPEALQIVISVVNRKIRGAECFAWDKNTNDFRAVNECIKGIDDKM